MANNFLDYILQKDTELLIYLNNLGNKNWDPFWLFVTDKDNWTPLFITLLFLVFYKFKLKKGLFFVVFVALLITFSDQFTNLIKSLTDRTRPCNVAEIQEQLRQFSYRPGGKSFWSGHASLSTTVTTLLILLLRRPFKFIYFLVLYPMLFGYSRVYLRVHYPIDVFCGYVSGIILGYISYKLVQSIYFKIFKVRLM